MLRPRFILVPLLLLAISPFIAGAQGPIVPPSAPAESARADQNSTDGLRLRLQDLLNAAKDRDVPKLKSLIKELEIPNYHDWFTKTFGEENGERMAENYGRNFSEGDSYLVTLFTQLASEDGEFTVRRVRDAMASRRTSEEEPPAPRVWRGPADPFIVTWKDGGLSASPRIRLVGTFVNLDGSFRLVSAFRQPVDSPGMSTYPNLRGPEKSSDASNSPSGAENDQETKRAGVGGAGYPTCVYCPAAEYSTAARNRRLEGTVVLQVLVQPDGSGTDIQVVKSPDPELTQMALDSVSKWRFNPARNANGEPVPAHVPIEVTFRLAK
ncbi:MAG: energy transducer TonB [Candidatus Acidiferrales bacterium]